MPDSSPDNPRTLQRPPGAARTSAPWIGEARVDETFRFARELGRSLGRTAKMKLESEQSLAVFLELRPLVPAAPRESQNQAALDERFVH